MYRTYHALRYLPLGCSGQSTYLRFSYVGAAMPWRSADSPDKPTRVITASGTDPDSF